MSEPLSRPSYNEGYIHTGTDGYNYQTFRSGGYTQRSYGNHPCQCCQGFQTMMNCQYGPPCYTRYRARKPDLVHC